MGERESPHFDKSSTMPLASRQALYLHQIRIYSAVLQFDISASYGLSVWKWYGIDIIS